MQSRGVGIIECLVAAVVVGIGFVAVYGLSTASTNVLMSSIEREKANMLSNMIFEDILTDTANIKDCPTTCPYNDMDFKSVSSGTVNSYDLHQTDWCTNANALLGSATVNDKRTIEINKVDTTTKFEINITIHSRNGRAQNKFMRVINAS